MAKIVSCKTCKKEVASNAKICPHCGAKNPGIKMKDAIQGFILIAIIISGIVLFSSEADYYNDYKERTLKEARSFQSSTIGNIAKEYIKVKNLPIKYEKDFSNCLGQLVHEKLDTFTIDKMLNWCYDDYKNSPNNQMKTYYNTASLIEDFSIYDGSYRPLEDIVKKSMKNNDSYEHVETLYSFVYSGKNITPHMNIKMTFKGTNSFGAIVPTTITAKVNAVTKKIYDIK